MNEALHVQSSNAFDASSLSMLRRIRGDAPAANEDSCADLQPADEADAWARHASGANGFGDAMAAPGSPGLAITAVEIHRRARAARSKAVASLIARPLSYLSASLRRALARYLEYRVARETIRALHGLDDRTLHDLGYDRSEIESVALEVSAARAR